MRLLFAFLAIPALAQQDGDAVLAGIRQKIRENLTRLPDYTCRLTIERSRRPSGAKRPQPIDTVHIEVGYVEGKELYAWPGQKFANKGLDEMLPAGGAVGTGDFALHAKSIFLGNSASFHYLGRSMQDGHEVVRFDFKIPRQKSRYLLRSGKGEQVVGYHGAFHADARTLALERLEIALDDIPAALRIRRAESILTYAVTRIGGADFLLPHSSELCLVDAAGNESRNRTGFEQCRQYLGESVVSFADPAAVAEQTPTTVTEIQLPPGLRIEITLKTAVEGTRAVIGDPIHAVVSRDVIKSGVVIVPKGAKVTGRITQIGQRPFGRLLYQMLGLHLSAVEFENHRAEFVGKLESLALASAQVTVGGGGPAVARGESLIFVKGNSLHLPSGTHMYWHTLNSRE